MHTKYYIALGCGGGAGSGGDDDDGGTWARNQFKCSSNAATDRVSDILISKLMVWNIRHLPRIYNYMVIVEPKPTR